MTHRRHVVFSELGAEILQQALALSGRPEEVLACPDFWQCGVLEPASREAWLRGHLGPDYPDYQRAHAAFWSHPFSTGETVLWTTRRSAREWTGCSEWLSRELGGDIRVNDLADVLVRGRPGVLHMLEPEDILAADLIDRAEIPSPADLELLKTHWRKLRDDNAPLRIVRDGELASAREDYPDRALLAHLEPRWKSAAIVIGETLCDDLEAWTFNFEDGVLAARLEALHATGVILTRPGERPPPDRTGMYALDIRLK